MPSALPLEFLATAQSASDHVWAVIKLLLMILIGLLLLIWWLRRQA